jgi:hypothetical protein
MNKTKNDLLVLNFYVSINNLRNFIVKWTLRKRIAFFVKENKTIKTPKNKIYFKNVST